MAAPPALRFLESRALVFRRSWRGTLTTAFLSPLLFLLAMGLGLGAVVDQSAAQELPGGSYLAFLAPGLLVATAMQVAATESTWPVMAGIEWVKTYFAATATPLRPVDLVLGQIGWALVRVIITSVAIGIVMVAVGAVPPLGAVVAIAPALAVGFAFAGPVMAFTARAKSHTSLASLFRFGIVPLFLFSGTFFPVDRLPELLQRLAPVSPLWHAAELARAAAFGTPSAWPAPLHTAVLLVLGAVGTVLAERWVRGRLRT